MSVNASSLRQRGIQMRASEVMDMLRRTKAGDRYSICAVDSFLNAVKPLIRPDIWKGADTQIWDQLNTLQIFHMLRLEGEVLRDVCLQTELLMSTLQGMTDL